MKAETAKQTMERSKEIGLDKVFEHIDLYAKRGIDHCYWQYEPEFRMEIQQKLSNLGYVCKHDKWLKLIKISW